MTITPTRVFTIEQVLAVLEAGETTTKTAELAGWPRQRVIALINGKRGWRLDYQTDRVIQEREPAPEPEEAERPQPNLHGTFAIVDVNRLEPHPDNPRDELGDLSELTASIGKHGILQPLTAHPHPTRDGLLQLLIGHRRHAAAQQAGLTQVPVIALPSRLTLEQAIEVMLIENCARRDLATLERAAAYGRLIDRGYTQQEVAARTGVAASTVARYLALRELDEETQERVRDGSLKFQDAVDAVKRTRRSAKEGRPNKGYSLEPAYFTKDHSLATQAKVRCTKRQHTTRPLLGKVACGPCWEAVIRLDQTENPREVPA